MCRREILDKHIHDRSIEYGSQYVNGYATSVDIPTDNKTSESRYIINYQEFAERSPKGPTFLEVDVIVYVDGANSWVAKSMDAGNYYFAIVFQEWIKISDENLKCYEEIAEMYIGDDVPLTLMNEYFLNMIMLE